MYQPRNSRKFAGKQFGTLKRWRRIRSWESRFRLFPPLFPSLSISTSVVTHDGNSHGGSIGQRLKGSKRSVGKLSRLQRQNLRPCVLSHPAKIRERREEENQFLTKCFWRERKSSVATEKKVFKIIENDVSRIGDIKVSIMRRNE